MIPTAIRIFVCTETVDMRFGFDRLAQVARERIGHDPIAGGALFVFGSKSATRLKVLWFEGHGICMLYKRLHRAVFELPGSLTGGASVHIDSVALAKLLTGVPRMRAQRKKSARADA